MWHPSSRHFFFPELKFFKNVNDSSKRSGIDAPQFLCLDWDEQRARLFNKKGFFVREGCPVGEEVTLLPPEYQETVENTVYAIPPAFKLEIERNVFRFVEERSLRRLTRNNVVLLPPLWEPGHEHLWVAFYLIADCAYDFNRGGYLRGALKVLLPYLLAYRFWCGQGVVDASLLLEHARIYRLERYYNEVYKRNEKFSGDIEVALERFREHAESWDEWVGSVAEERSALHAALRQRKYEEEIKAKEAEKNG